MAKDTNKIKATKILTIIGAVLAFLCVISSIMLVYSLNTLKGKFDEELLNLGIYALAISAILLLGIAIALIILAAKCHFTGGFTNKTFIIYNAVLSLLPLVVAGIALLVALKSKSKIDTDSIFTLACMLIVAITSGLGTMNTVHAVKIK